MAGLAVKQSHLRWGSCLRLIGSEGLSISVRCRSDKAPTSRTATLGEENIRNKLKLKFPKAAFIEVSDISGGCGSMYQVQVITEEFRGCRTVLQHRMVNEALKEEIKIPQLVKVIEWTQRHDKVWAEWVVTQGSNLMGFEVVKGAKMEYHIICRLNIELD